MKKLLKIILMLLLLAIVAIGGTLVFLDLIVEKFRPEIEDAISSTVDQPVSFSSLSVSLFPNIALVLEDASIGEGEQTLSVDEILLNTKLADLFQGKISVQQLQIRGADISLRRDTISKQISIAGIDLAKVGKKKSQGQTSSSKSANNFSLAIDSVELQKVNFRWIDEAVTPTQTIELQNLNASFYNIDLSKPTPSGSMELSAGVFGKKDNLRALGKLDVSNISSPAELSIKLQELDLDRLQSIAKSYNVLVNDGLIKDESDIDIKLSFENNELITEGTLDYSNASISYGDLFKKKSGEKFVVEGRAVGGFFNPKYELSGLKFSLGNINITGDFEYSTRGKRAKGKFKTNTINLSEVRKFTNALDKLDLKGKIKTGGMETQLTLPSFGTRYSQRFNGSLTLQNISAKLPAGEKTLSLSKASGSVEMKDKKIKSEDLSFSLNEQAITANVSADLTENSRVEPVVNYSIKSAKVELWPLIKDFNPDLETLKDSFLQGFQAEGKHEPGSGHGDVVVNIDKSKIHLVDVGKTKLVAELDSGAIFLQPSDINVFGGDIKIQGKAYPERKLVEVALVGEGLDASQVAKLAIPNSPISLTGNVSNIDVKADTSLAQPIRSANGSAHLEIVEGKITGINIVGRAIQMLKKAPGIEGEMDIQIPPEHEEELNAPDTNFDSLKVEASLQGETMHIHKATVDHPLYRIEGDGFLKHNGDFRLEGSFGLSTILLEAMILREPKLKILIDKHGALSIPIVLESENGQMFITPDTRTIARRAIRNTAKEAAGRAIDRLAPGLGGVVDSLF